MATTAYTPALGIYEPISLHTQPPVPKNHQQESQPGAQHAAGAAPGEGPSINAVGNPGFTSVPFFFSS